MAGEHADDVGRGLGRIFGAGTIAGLTDAQLLERFAARNDAVAFEALVARHGPMVLGVCRRRLRDAHAAEDAFQATFLVLVRKARPGPFRTGDSLGPWLHAVAWRVAERARTEAARRLSREEAGAALEQAPAPPAPGAEARDVRASIDEELGRLPERYRLPVVLCYLEGLTHEEAARRLGCPPGTIGVRLMRARARLRGRLVRRGLAPLVAASAEALLSEETARAAVPPGLLEATIRTATGTGTAPATAAILARGVVRAMLRSKIRKVALGLISLGMVTALAIAFVPAAVKDELKPGKSIVGRVVDTRDQPIAGAKVWLSVGLNATLDPPTHVVTDAEGRFAVPVRREWLEIDRYNREGIVWALAPAHSLGMVHAYRSIWGNDPAGITIALGTASDTAFVVLGPDGRPVAGARVEPYRIKTTMAYLPPPEGMLATIGGVTDDRGRVQLPALERKGLFVVAVATPAYGRQQLQLRDREDEPAQRTIRLRQVGRVEGRVIAVRPEHVRGLTVFLTTEDRGHDPTTGQTESEATAVTDDQGRFTVPNLASGTLKVGVGVAREWPVRPRIPEALVVRPGETTRFAFALEPAVKVRGIIRDKKTQAPLAAATIVVQYDKRRQDDRITTGPDGRYETYVVPGDVTLHVVIDPEGYVQLGAPWAEPVRVPPGVEVFELPPVELVKTGPAIVGKLIDGRDRPLADVQIVGGEGNRRYGFARTDAHGAFRIEGVPAALKLTYDASADDEQAVPTEVVSADPLVLRVRLRPEKVKEAGPGGAISARVVDSHGAPVGRVELILYETINGPDGREVSGSIDVFGVTDTQGGIRKAYAVVKGNEYRVIVQPVSVAVAGSATIKANGRNPVVLPPIVVERLGEIAGQVVDTAGKPIRGATVLNWGNRGLLTVAGTGDDGEFRLDGVPPGAIFLFAEATGHRFHAEPISSPAGPLRLTLRRRDAAPERTLSRLGPAAAAPGADEAGPQGHDPLRRPRLGRLRQRSFRACARGADPDRPPGCHRQDPPRRPDLGP